LQGTRPLFVWVADLVPGHLHFFFSALGFDPILVYRSSPSGLDNAVDGPIAIVVLVVKLPHGAIARETRCCKD